MIGDDTPPPPADAASAPDLDAEKQADAAFPAFPSPDATPPPATNRILLFGFVLITLAFLVFLRVTARRLLVDDEGGPIKGGNRVDFPLQPVTPAREERPPIDPVARAELVAKAHTACIENDLAACIGTVDQLEAQGESTDPDLLAQRIIALAKKGEIGRAEQLARFFGLRYAEHPMRKDIAQALEKARPASSARMPNATKPAPRGKH